MTEFKKFDSVKPQLSLLPVHPLIEASKVMAFGANKYGRDNWKSCKKQDIHRYFDALLRHTYAALEGEEKDPESNLRHIDHVTTNAMFLSYLLNRFSTDSLEKEQ